MLPSTYRQPRRNIEHHQLDLEKVNYNNWSLICQHKAQCCYKLDGISMGAPVEAPAVSSSDVERPTTNSVRKLHGTPHTSSGRIAGSPEKSNTNAQKPHDAIFMYKRALNTSLWKIWVATMIFQKTKANGKRKMRTNTRANQKYRPHPPALSLTINLHVAECPQMWILLIHLQKIFQAAHDVHDTVSFACFFGSTTTCCNLFQHSPHALRSLPDDNNWIVETSSSISSSRSSLAMLPPKGEMIPTSSSVELNISSNEWRG